MDRASGTFDPRRMSYLQDVSILNDNSDFGINERDPRWYEALQKYQRSETYLQSSSQPHGFNTVQIEQRRSIYLVNNDESTRNNFSVHSFESLSDMSLSPAAVLKNKKNMYKMKSNKSPASLIRKSVLLRTNSRNTMSNSPSSSITNENDSLESFFKKPSMASKPPQQFFKKQKVSENGAFVGAVEATTPESRDSSINDSFFEKVYAPKLFSKQKSKRGLFTDISNRDTTSVEAPRSSPWLSDESIHTPIAQNPTNLRETEKESTSSQFNEIFDMEPKKSLFKKTKKADNKMWILDAISFNNSKNMSKSPERQPVVIEDQVCNEPEKISDDAYSEESETCLNASRRSSVSETINYEKFKQLASSTVISSDMSPRVSHFKKNMKHLSRKSSVIDFLNDIEEQDDQNATLSEENIDSPSPVDDVPLQLLENDDHNMESKTAQISVINSSRENVERNKETSLHGTKEVDEAELSESKENSIRKSSEMIKMASIREELPKVNIDDSPEQELQMQSPDLAEVIREISASEKSGSISTQLNQSEIDRAVIEEMKNKRTNPPVRRSTVILSQNPLISDENSDDDTIVDDKQPLRHSNIPILPLITNDNFDKNQSDKRSNISVLSKKLHTENIEIDELPKEISQSNLIVNSQKYSESADEISQGEKGSQNNDLTEHIDYDKNVEFMKINEIIMEDNEIIEMRPNNEKLHESNTEIVENEKIVSSLANQDPDKNVEFLKIDENIMTNDEIIEMQQDNEKLRKSNTENVHSEENLSLLANQDRDNVEFLKIDENISANNEIIEMQQNNEKLHKSNTEIVHEENLSLFTNQNDKNLTIEVKDNDNGIELLNNIEQEKVSVSYKEIDENFVDKEKSSRITYSENMITSENVVINLNNSKPKNNTNIDINSTITLEGNNENSKKSNPNSDTSLMQKSTPEIQTILNNSKAKNSSVIQSDIDPANVTLKANEINKISSSVENTSEIFDNALEKSQNEKDPKVSDMNDLNTVQNKNTTRNTNLDMELTIFDVPDQEIVLKKINGIANRTAEFSLDSLENVSVLSKKYLTESVKNKTDENLLDSFNETSDSESDASGNASLIVSEDSNDSDLSRTVKNSQEKNSISRIANKENISSSSEHRNKNGNILNENKIIYDEERMSQLKEILKKNMEEKKKQAEIAVQKMFEPQKNSRDVLSLRTPWNLLHNHKKPLAKSLKSKLQGIPSKKVAKDNKKLYMKERWITKRLYDFIQKKLEPKHGFFTRAKSEEFIISLAQTVKVVLKKKDYHSHVSALKTEMAELKIVKTHHDFHEFIRNYLPFHFRIKAIPAFGRDIPDINGGLFDNILAEN